MGAIGVWCYGPGFGEHFIESTLSDFPEDTIESQPDICKSYVQLTHKEGKANPYAFLLPTTVPELEASAANRIKWRPAAFLGVALQSWRIIAFIYWRR